MLERKKKERRDSNAKALKAGRAPLPVSQDEGSGVSASHLYDTRDTYASPTGQASCFGLEGLHAAELRLGNCVTSAHVSEEVEFVVR